MAVSSEVQNIAIEPVNVSFGNQHLVCVDTVAGTSLGGKYFKISSLLSKFYVWFNTGASTDPAPSGYTEIEVAILVGDTAAQVATKIATAVNAVAATNKIHAKAKTSQGKVLLEVKGLGAPLEAWADVDTTMVLTVLREGSELAFGYLDGDVELTLEGQFFDVMAHQTGSEMLAKLLTGTNVGPLTLTLKETVAAKLKTMLEVLGNAYTPSGGTEVTALGALTGSKQFSNVFEYSKSIVMHPTKNSDSDLSGDFMFWVGFPNLKSLKFSGEADRKLEIEISFFLDEVRVNEASKLVYGDWQQNYLKA